MRREAPRGDLDATLRAVRRFGRRQWLKVAAGGKARLLQAALRPGDRVLERLGGMGRGVLGRGSAVSWASRRCSAPSGSGAWVEVARW